ncbi:unnamed protein product [Caenorhabditis nigoni]
MHKELVANLILHCTYTPLISFQRNSSDELLSTVNQRIVLLAQAAKAYQSHKTTHCQDLPSAIREEPEPENGTEDGQFSIARPLQELEEIEQRNKDQQSTSDDDQLAQGSAPATSPNTATPTDQPVTSPSSEAHVTPGSACSFPLVVSSSVLALFSLFRFFRFFGNSKKKNMELEAEKKDLEEEVINKKIPNEESKKCELHGRVVTVKKEINDEKVKEHTKDQGCRTFIFNPIYVKCPFYLTSLVKIVLAFQ